MARKQYVDLSNSIEAWRQKNNITSDYIGDLDDLNLSTPYDQTIVRAINHLDSRILDENQIQSLFEVIQTGPTTLSSLTYDDSTGTFYYNTVELVASHIPFLDAGKINTGVFDTDRIPSLPASKIGSGVLDVLRIPNLPASKITSGQLNANNIPCLDAAKICTGQFNPDRIPDLPASKIINDRGYVCVNPDREAFAHGTYEPQSTIVYADGTSNSDLGKIVSVTGTIPQTIFNWYLNDLKRNPDKGGFEFWYNTYLSAGEAATRSAFLNSNGFAVEVSRGYGAWQTFCEFSGSISETIFNWYLDDLGRNPDRAGFEFWYNVYKNVGEVAARAAFLGSDGFADEVSRGYGTWETYCEFTNGGSTCVDPDIQVFDYGTYQPQSTIVYANGTTSTNIDKVISVTSNDSITKSSLPSNIVYTDGDMQVITGNKNFNGSVYITGQFLPLSNGQIDIGTSSSKFKDVYANRFVGTVTQSVSADLAEKYLADKVYEYGTVVAIGGDKEITIATKKNSHSIIGIVSQNPGFIMNSDLEDGTLVALKGRTPLRVKGKVKKGDRLVISDISGHAESNNKSNEYIGISLEDGSGIIEAYIR